MAENIHFALFHPVKIGGRVGEVSESVFEALPRSQSLIYFWRGAIAPAWRFNSLFSARLLGWGSDVIVIAS